ncbi:PTS glucose transporter subunit IIA [Staphylococcus aureus]|nr:PTS glucose transporter subunit IIA [Staphylococcus aureus]
MKRRRLYLHVEEGQEVKQGDLLINFDLDYIRNHAKSDNCLLYHTYAADEKGGVTPGCRRNIKNNIQKRRKRQSEISTESRASTSKQ